MANMYKRCNILGMVFGNIRDEILMAASKFGLLSLGKPATNNFQLFIIPVDTISRLLIEWVAGTPFQGFESRIPK